MKLYTTSQLALKCGYAGDAVIRKMIQDNKLKADKYGKTWIITEKNALMNKNINKRIYLSEKSVRK